jgi:protease I
MPSPGARIAILLEEGFDDDELERILSRLNGAGLTPVLVAPLANRTYTGRHRRLSVTSDVTAAPAAHLQAAAVLIPGGHAPDRLRMRHGMLDLVRDALAAGIPVGAVGHGAQVLISAAAVAGRTITCWPSIAIDVKNAGGSYVDRPVVEDRGVITARKADDVAAFTETLFRAIARSR